MRGNTIRERISIPGLFFRIVIIYIKDREKKKINFDTVLFNPVSESALCAITKYCRLSGLNNRHLFLPAPEVGNSKDRVPAQSILVTDPPL